MQSVECVSLIEGPSHIYTKMAISGDKQFRLDFQLNSPPVCVEQSCVKFSSDKELIIEPGKTKRLHSGLFIHQKGNYVIHVQPMHFYTSLLMLPSSCSLKLLGPDFTLVNYGEHPISIPAHKLWFKATFADIETAVDCVQDLPGSPGLQSMEQQLSNIHSCNFLEYKQQQQQHQQEPQEPKSTIQKSTEMD